MTEKWDLPFGPLPSWLDESAEIKKDGPKPDSSTFIVNCMNDLLSLGCDPWQAAGVSANAMNETGNGKYYIANNCGGWKCTKSAAEAYASSHDGKSIPFWRAHGNKAPGATVEDYKGGDPPTVYYRAFDSVKEFLSEWLTHFVPKFGEPAPYGAYRKCGRLFWSHGDWFRELCMVGYKGENTRKHPEAAIAEHHSLVVKALTIWAQYKLGVEPDGAWGKQSKKACSDWQSAHGIQVTGQPDPATLRSLSRPLP